ncbi:MAG: hypothetical protein AAFW82_03810 [Pseudomonadota bacterium]
MTDTKHKFTSFAAPTPEDIAAFDALSDAEQKAVIEEELAKGFRGKPVRWTSELKEQILQQALENVSRRNARN